MKHNMKPETQALHAGWRADPTTGSVAVPIHQTTSFQFRDTDHAANLFGLNELGNIYTRIMNPTVDVLEQRIAAMESGAAAVAVSSGQTASAYALQNLAKAGDNVVASTGLYGGTWNLFSNTFKDMGIEVRFVDSENPSAFEKGVDDRTRAFYAETLPNPKLHVFPIADVAAIGRKHGIPLIMDNTAAASLVKPFDHGAAIVMYSTTKYIGGHGTSIGGIVVDGGNFDWEAAADRQCSLNQPDPSYHGVVWSQAAKPLGPIAYALKLRTTLLRDLGGAMSPHSAFMFIQGLETLPLRMRQHCENAQKVADFLTSHNKIAKVIYPGLMTGTMRQRADDYMSGGYGALIGIELKGGVEMGKNFINALKLLYHVANIGDARSLAIHPASTTHSQLFAEDQLRTGVTAGYVRLSIGIEHVDDIIDDIKQALDIA